MTLVEDTMVGATYPCRKTRRSIRPQNHAIVWGGSSTSVRLFVAGHSSVTHPTRPNDIREVHWATRTLAEESPK